jgi:hypothetical protein
MLLCLVLDHLRKEDAEIEIEVFPAKSIHTSSTLTGRRTSDPLPALADDALFFSRAVYLFDELKQFVA